MRVARIGKPSGYSGIGAVTVKFTQPELVWLVRSFAMALYEPAGNPPALTILKAPALAVPVPKLPRSSPVHPGAENPSMFMLSPELALPENVMSCPTCAGLGETLRVTVTPSAYPILRFAKNITRTKKSSMRLRLALLRNPTKPDRQPTRALLSLYGTRALASVLNQRPSSLSRKKASGPKEERNRVSGSDSF